MKTSVEIEEDKLEQARRLAPEARTLRELLDIALVALISERRRKGLISLLGSGNAWEGDLKKLRKKRGPG